MKTLPPSERRQIRARISWCLYDWANSAFATVILAAVLPVYFASLVPEEGAAFAGKINIPATAFWGYSVALSMLVVALVAAPLGALADRHGYRVRLLRLFCVCGSIATATLFVTGPGSYLLAAALFIVGNISFAGGNIFYNALLPTLVAPGEKDINRLSSYGFASGYIGGGLALLLVFMLIQRGEWFGVGDPALAARIGFLLTGGWWLIFALPCLFLIDEPPLRAQKNGRPGWRESFRHLRRYPDLLRFLLAFLLYNDGIQTIIAVSAIFAREELGLSTGTILGCFLMIQFVAMPGSLIFGKLATKIGSKWTIVFSLVVFTGIGCYAAVLRSATEFWILGFFVALVLGGSQAISRSFFATMTPPGRQAEFFGFYAISSKFASIFGPLIFALIIDLSGSNRWAIFSLIGFFLVGGALLMTVNPQRATRALSDAPD